MFQHARGAINPDYLSQRFAIYTRNAGPDGVGVRGLRHTAITRLIERGVPVPTVQRSAGHADVATTMRYGSLAADVYAEQVRAAPAAWLG
ncbi:MAG TPA: tyrosine-type recombinase/integrase [Rubricoccaceae bacterium]|nr:tyrosine-type recombinase/integrase [Rubricoccaceae bacterium]